jgi:hypothetical protein
MQPLGSWIITNSSSRRSRRRRRRRKDGIHDVDGDLLGQCDIPGSLFIVDFEATLVRVCRRIDETYCIALVWSLADTGRGSAASLATTATIVTSALSPPRLLQSSLVLECSVEQRR